MYYEMTLTTKSDVSKEIYNKIADEFMDAYGRFVNYVNPKYQEWNDEYYNLGWPLDGLDDDGKVRPTSESKYNSFIVNKYKMYITNINFDNKSEYIDYFYIGDAEQDFRAKLKDGNDLHFEIDYNTCLYGL